MADQIGDQVDKLRQSVADQMMMAVYRQEDWPSFFAEWLKTDWHEEVRKAVERRQERATQAGHEMVTCFHCNSQFAVMNMVSVYDVPLVARGYFCPPCAVTIRDSFRRVCAICGEEYMPQTAQEAHPLCANCVSEERVREDHRLHKQLLRAQQANVAATLTLGQWIHTLDTFHWLCAYCQSVPLECMEHFVPIIEGGGTTADNCVPACQSCNSRKGYRHPLKIDEPELAGRIVPVQVYLLGAALSN